MTGQNTGRDTRYNRKLFHSRFHPFLVISCACLAFLSIGLAGNADANIQLSQANGDTLTLAKPANRIITLAPNLAELVFAAGAGDRLLAVVEYSDYPQAVLQVPQVGNAFRIDLERIVELKPDLVIAWQSGNPQTALLKLKQLGITVWQMEITRPEQIAEAVENISVAAGTESSGLAVAGKLREKLASLEQENTGKPSIEFFYQVAARPLYTINDQHIISRSLEICGGHNVFAELQALAPQISREAVILADPQVMFAPDIPGEPPALKQWQEWSRLQAVQNKAMLYLPADAISRAGPRLLDSIELACKLLDEVRTATRQ
jgi:iron complex transport system substrate-binding protein